MAKYQIWLIENGYIQGKKLGRPLASLRSVKNKIDKHLSNTKLEKANEADTAFWIESDTHHTVGLVQKLD